MRLRPAVFLDRDGVLNADEHGYVHRLSDLRLLPGVPAALAALHERGYLLIVVSNQSGIARGLYDFADVERFHAGLNLAVAAAGGVPVDDFFYCPHHVAGSVAALSYQCGCRKPEPGMVFEAQGRHGIDLAASYLVGDRSDDISCAERAGLRGGFQVISTGHPAHPRALAYTASLAEAVPLIPAP